MIRAPRTLTSYALSRVLRRARISREGDYV